jgi:hypothetical protein
VALSEAKRLASDQAERALLERALLEAGGLVTELARYCDMGRSHMRTLLKKHGIRSKDFRAVSKRSGRVPTGTRGARRWWLPNGTGDGVGAARSDNAARLRAKARQRAAGTP